MEQCLIGLLVLFFILLVEEILKGVLKTARSLKTSITRWKHRKEFHIKFGFEPRSTYSGMKAREKQTALSSLKRYLQQRKIEAEQADNEVERLHIVQTAYDESKRRHWLIELYYPED